MGRVATSERKTPLFDQWRERFAEATNADGAKTAAAGYLAAHLEGSPGAARVTIHRILTRRVIPTAEILLCLDEWMETAKKRK